MQQLRYLLVSLVLLLAGCQSTQGGQQLVAPPGSPVIFRLGGDTYTVADFAQRLERDIGPGIADLQAQGQTREQIELLANQNNVRASVFDQLLQDALLTQYARRNGIGIDPEAIDAALVAQAPTNPLSPTNALRLEAAQQQLVFEVIARNTRTEMVHVRQILAADDATADAVLAQLQAGADFAALVQQFSQDSASLEQGGDLGWLPRGDAPPEFEAVAFSAPLNTPTKAVSQIGPHVIEVLGREADHPFASFEQLRGSTNAQQFYEQSFLPWYEQLRGEAESSGELQLAPGFDPNSIPLPFAPGSP